MELFIKDLKIDNVRGIENFLIPLTSEERKHLILTGKNGSGKTSTLNEINNLLTKLHNNQFQTLQNFYDSINNMRKAIERENTSINAYRKNIENAVERINALNKMILDSETTDPINRERTIHQSQKEIIAQNNNINTFTQNINAHSTNIHSYNSSIDNYKKRIKDFSKININFVNQEYVYRSLNEGNFIMAFFQAKRENKPKVPNGVQKLQMQKKNPTTSNLSLQFIQYLVNLRMEMLDAMAENEDEEVRKINNWFDNFENSLKELFDNSELKLKYKKKEFNYKIEYDNKSFGLNELSDGYSAVLSIITELILRMEAHNVANYDLQGVVLIDELETHLHVSLQKKILPFLTKFFPKIQFIITTHSPFILSSLSNVVICDLEKKIITEDLSAYSYESLVDSYFDIDKYSNKLKEDLEKFRELTIKYKKKNISDDEKTILLKLENHFDNLSFFGNEEIGVTLKQIKDMF
jgi:predicted ATP-binding protein involved in virulence